MSNKLKKPVNYIRIWLTVTFFIGFILDVFFFFDDRLLLAIFDWFKFDYLNYDSDSVYFLVLMPPILLAFGYLFGSIHDTQYKKTDKYKTEVANYESANQKLIEDSYSYEKRRIQAYNDLKLKFMIPDNALKVNYKGGHANLLNSESYIWIDNDNLCFFPANPPDYLVKAHYEKVILYKIPINKIEYYATRGKIVHENKITGGGGGGSSIKGAIVGGVIAGGAGAIIGSRKKTEPIKSELIAHDTRETFINFFDDNNIKHSMFFNLKDYSVFSKLIPKKSFEAVNTLKTNNILNKVINENETSSITEQIRELAKLKEEGILTEEEFSEKKKLLLNKIS